MLGTQRTPNSEAEVLSADIGTWEDIGAIQAQGVATVVTVHSRRPIVTVVTPTIR